jgi:hypothetical protein
MMNEVTSQSERDNMPRCNDDFETARLGCLRHPRLAPGASFDRP